jgi:hypothetical protein
LVESVIIGTQHDVGQCVTRDTSCLEGRDVPNHDTDLVPPRGMCFVVIGPGTALADVLWMAVKHLRLPLGFNVMPVCFVRADLAICLRLGSSVLEILVF